MPTEKDDKEVEYGKWQEHTPEETAAESRHRSNRKRF